MVWLCHINYNVEAEELRRWKLSCRHRQGTFFQLGLKFSYEILALIFVFRTISVLNSKGFHIQFVLFVLIAAFRCNGTL